MKTIGIISEYNPFHNGHKYHIEASRKLAGDDTCVVACMSGSFMQRGAPAIFDKWTRAELAVKCGVDLVIELPFISACSSAERFAEGGIRLLNALGCIDYVSFGSESGDMQKLKKVSEFLIDEPEEFRQLLKAHLDEGLSFPAARQKAIESCLGPDYSDAIMKPNNILATEYLKQLALQKSDMKPLTVLREGESHDEETSNVINNRASALHIRNNIKAGEDFWWYVPWKSEFMPFSAASLKAKPVFADSMYEPALAQILRSDAEELAEIASMREGFENRLKDKVRYSKDWEDLMRLLKTKRFTRTAIQRMIVHVLMGLTREKHEKIADNSTYMRVLAFNDKGASLIKSVKKGDSKIKIITNVNKDVLESDSIYPSVELDIKAADLYNMLAGNDLYKSSDFVKKPFSL